MAEAGGIFYVLVPNMESAEARVFGSYWHGLELPRHLFHYSPASLKFLAESAGLQEVSLETRRNPAVGTSLRYVWDDVFSAGWASSEARRVLGKASLPWRAARKLVRMTVLRGLLAMAPLVGGGESIHAIFRKEETSQVRSMPSPTHQTSGYEDHEGFCSRVLTKLNSLWVAATYPFAGKGRQSVAPLCERDFATSVAADSARESGRDREQTGSTVAPPGRDGNRE